MAGELDVDGMLRRMKPSQLVEWKAYADVEPFGAIRDNYHAAIIAKIIADAHGAKIGGRPFKYEDFLLNFKEVSEQQQQQKPQTQTWQQKKSIAMMIAKAAALAAEGEKRELEQRRRMQEEVRRHRR